MDTSKSNDQKKMKVTKANKTRLIKTFLIFIALVAVSGAVVVALLYFKSPTAVELYKKSIENAINTQSDDVYISFDVDSDDTKIRGELSGNPNGDKTSLKADMDVSYELQGVPMDLSAESLAYSVKKNDKDFSHENYIKYKRLTTTIEDYKQNVEGYFSPVINKWVKLDEQDNINQSTSFEEDGAMAVLVTSGIFMPVTKLSESDKKIYLDAIDKYDLYQVGEAIEQTRFRGIESRKIRVSVKKASLIEFEREVSVALTDDANFKKFDTQFLDQLFGKDDDFYADVYIDPKNPKIIGVDVRVNLDNPIQENSFNTTIDEVSSSLFVQYGRKLNIEKPENAISQSEMDVLLNG